MKPFSIILSFILLLFSISSLAQRFGGFPPSTKWKQIPSDTANVIYSGGSEFQAKRISALIHHMASDTPFALGSRIRQINILLHHRTTYANGYVALGPFRSEFYLVPGANVYENGNLSWYENLAIHEYRHVQQYNNFRNGLSKGFLYLFGQEGLALANAMAVPDWFFEGDAVHAETALTKQGRGRLPYFLSGFNSLWISDKDYSWQKLRNGSMKDYVPNHYQLGYLLANYGYIKYGDEFWKKVTQDATAFRGIFYPFQRAIKRHSGVNFKTFRKEAFDFYREQIDSIKETSDAKRVQGFYYPQFIGQDSLLYLKTAYNKNPAFYISVKGKEQRIALRNISSEDWFSYRNGKIAYTAFSTDPRWSLVDNSDIVILDIDKGNTKRITRREKYYTPDLSPSGEKLVAVVIDDSLQTHLRILNSENGSVIKEIRSENELYFTNPRFAGEHTIIAGHRSSDSKMSLQLYDLQKEQWQELLPASYSVISVPFVYNEKVYFTSNVKGNDDIYELDLRSKKLFRLTEGVTGNYFPSVQNNELVWSHFTADGLSIRTSSLDKTIREEISVTELLTPDEQYPVALPSDGSFTTPIQRKSSTRYRKSTNLLNFHSWRPDYVDPEFTFTMYSDNVLNTFSNELFYRYNQNENSSAVGINMAYGGWYPVIRGGAEYTFNRNIRTPTRTYTLDQSEVRIGYYIPFNFTKGKTYKFSNFGSDLIFNRTTPTGISRQFIRGRDLNYLRHFLSYSQQLPMAIQHIVPKVGYSLAAQHRHMINEEGYQFFGNGNLYLPSFGNHGIVINAAVQQVDTGTFIFSNRFAGARGYEEYYFSKMWKIGANYHLPLFYPDFGIASIVYFQRVRANLFYDFARFYSNERIAIKDLRSTGGEIFFDTKWWNQQPVSFGFRVSYLLDDGFSPNDTRGSTWVEFVLPVSLIQ